VPAPPAEQPKKKEKAHLKTPIPGTDWLRVTTTEGNVFYSNKTTKQSSWTVPPEIIGAVHALEQEENAPPFAPEASEAKAKAAKDGKRKRDGEQIVPLEELVSKKAKIDEEEEGDSEEDSDDEEEEEWQREAAEQLAREAEEERIRRREEAKRKEEEERKAKEEEEKAKNMLKLNMPEKVELSVEEGKALFKVCSFIMFWDFE
jgi:hypothetical protein